jgi:hypothetical protein
MMKKKVEEEFKNFQKLITDQFFGKNIVSKIFWNENMVDEIFEEINFSFEPKSKEDPLVDTKKNILLLGTGEVGKKFCKNSTEKENQPFSSKFLSNLKARILQKRIMRISIECA